MLLRYWPGVHTNTEDAYVGCIAAFVKKLDLNKPIICGASMAGQICLAVAVRCDEVGAGGTIPLQGSDYLNMERQWFDRSPYVNQALFNPEWIYGVSSSYPALVIFNKTDKFAADDESNRAVGQSSTYLAHILGSRIRNVSRRFRFLLRGLGWTYANVWNRYETMPGVYVDGRIRLVEYPIHEPGNL